MDRTEKREFVAGLHEALAATSMIVVTHNTGLTVAEATDLRRRMRAAGVTFRVAKNRLAHLALEGTQFDGLKPMLTGSDRARVVGRTRWRRPRRPSSSPGPTRSSC